jgi:hypothetical protein
LKDGEIDTLKLYVEVAFEEQEQHKATIKVLKEEERSLKLYVARCEAGFKEQKEITEQHEATIKVLKEEERSLKLYVARCEAGFKEQKEITEQHEAKIQVLEKEELSLKLELKDLSDTNRGLLGTIQRHEISDQEQNDRVLAQKKLIEHQKQAIKGLGTDHQLEAQQREKEICVLQDQLDDLRKQLDNCQFISSPQLDNCQFISSPQDINSPENLANELDLATNGSENGSDNDESNNAVVAIDGNDDLQGVTPGLETSPHVDHGNNAASLRGSPGTIFPGNLLHACSSPRQQMNRGGPESSATHGAERAPEDREWLGVVGLKNTEDYELLAVTSRQVRKRDYITVTLKVQNSEMKALLCKNRNSSSESPVKVAFSKFLAAGGSETAALTMLEKINKECVERRKKRKETSRQRAKDKRLRGGSDCMECEKRALRGIAFGSSGNTYRIVKDSTMQRGAFQKVLCCKIFYQS